MSDEDNSGSETTLSSSPSNRSIFSGGSDLFKTALDDYILEAEYERYKQKKHCNIIKSDDHVTSARCVTCLRVKTLCKCDETDSIGHESRVHWADEVWNKPLFTVLNPDSEDESSEESESVRACSTASSGSKFPKPILKHRANCIIIVSN